MKFGPVRGPGVPPDEDDGDDAHAAATSEIAAA
jgi:hypothetical protein